MTLSWKPTLLILIGCTAVWAAVWWIERSAEPVVAPKPDIQTRNVVDVEVRIPQRGLRWRAVRRDVGFGQRWMIVEPFEEPARQESVEAILIGLATLDPRALAPIEPGADRSQYGLTDETAMRVVCVRQEDGSEVSFRVGTLDPISRQYHAVWIGHESHVYLLPVTCVQAMSEEPPVAPAVIGMLDRTALSRVEMTIRSPAAGGGVREELIALRYDSGGWVLEEPRVLAGERADAGAMESFFAVVLGLRAEEFVRAAEAEEARAMHGLGEPGRRIRFVMGARARELRLAAEGGDGGSAWAWSDEFPRRVARIARADYDRFPRSRNDFRSKQVYRWLPGQVVWFRVEARDTNGTMVRVLEVERVGTPGSESGGAQWTIREPRDTGGLQPPAAQYFLERLPGMNLEEFVEDAPENYAQYGLDPPSIVLRLRLDDGSEIEYRYGVRGSIYFGRCADRPAVFRVAPEHYLLLRLCDLLLQPTRVLTFEPSRAQEVWAVGTWRVTPLPATPYSWRVEKDAEERWRWGAATVDATLSEAKVAGLVQRLSELDTESYVTWDREAWERYGLTEDARRATLGIRYRDLHGEDREIKIHISNPVEQKVYAMAEGLGRLDGVVWLCPDWLWRRLTDPEEGVWEVPAERQRPH